MKPIPFLGFNWTQRTQTYLNCFTYFLLFTIIEKKIFYLRLQPSKMIIYLQPKLFGHTKLTLFRLTKSSYLLQNSLVEVDSTTMCK